MRCSGTVSASTLKESAGTVSPPGWTWTVGTSAQRKPCAAWTMKRLAGLTATRYTFVVHRFWRVEMDKIKQIGAAALITALLGGLSACDQMTTRQRDTAVGAGVGGVAGAALGGSALSTVGGAAAGGLIGNQVGK
jgi:osmotically inducible lipoprotein OsmB